MSINGFVDFLNLADVLRNVTGPLHIHVCQCNGTFEECYPQFGWISDFMNDERTKEELGVPPGLVFGVLNKEVTEEFVKAGDQYVFFSLVVHVIFE